MEREIMQSNPTAAPQIDRTAIRRLLQLTPGERVRLAIEEARKLQQFDQRLKRK